MHFKAGKWENETYKEKMNWIPCSFYLSLFFQTIGYFQIPQVVYLVTYTLPVGKTSPDPIEIFFDGDGTLGTDDDFRRGNNYYVTIKNMANNSIVLDDKCASITDEAIEAAVKLSVRYINDRFLPDKAIDLIDEAA